MHLDSIKKEHWFFFAQTGLQITYWLMFDLQKGDLFENAILPHIDQIIKIWDEDKER